MEENALAEQYQQLKDMIENISGDIDKAQTGNKAAGTRVRTSMMDIKNLAQDIRKTVLDLRNSG